MNKLVYLGISILQLSKILMYDNVGHCVNRYRKSKYIQNKTDDIYKGIAADVETRFDTSNYELDRPLPKGKNKKLIGLMKNELDGKIMTKFVGLRAKT